MNPSMSLLEVPRGHYSRVLKEAVRRYPSGYAERLFWAGKTWLMCSSLAMPIYPKYFQQFSTVPQGLAICSIHGGIFIYAWHGTDILLCFWGTGEQVNTLLRVLSERPEYTPEIWLDTAAEQEFEETLAKFMASKRLLWPRLTERENRAIKMLHVKRLSSKPWLGLFTTLSLMIFLSYCVLVWSPWHSDIEATDPVLDFSQRLTTAKANVIPLLRLDYNIQLKLLQVHGWLLQSVEYNPQQVTYRLDREAGNVKTLRQFADANQLSMTTSGRQAVLTRAIQLPTAIDSPNNMKWHTVTELTDWLDQHLALWLPLTELKLGSIEQIGPWQKQTITIELRDYYLPDLLTLAGILDGLPLQLQRGVLRIQNDLIQGQITLAAIGALG